MFFLKFTDTSLNLMLNVLLVAPKDPKTPGNLKFLMGGESTYTNTLFSSSPFGVKYFYFQQAFKNGDIEQIFLQKLLNFFVKFRILPVSAGTQCFKVNKKYDLIHCHGYSLKVINSDVPILLSDSSSNYVFLKDYLGWPEWRISFGFFLRRRIFKLFGVSDPDTNLENVKKLLVFSKYAKKIHLKFTNDKNKIEIVKPGILKNRVDSKKEKSIVNILFIGIWFERKGGNLLLEAYKRLLKRFSNIKLTIVGPVPKKYKFKSDNIDQIDYVPREKLLKYYFPKADIFVLVPPKVEGFGFVLLEAMSFGIPCVVTNVCALPEVVDKKSGFVIKPNNILELEKVLEKLIVNKKLREKMGACAKENFSQNFDIEMTNRELVKIYRKVISS